MFLLQHPAERALVVREHLSNSLVAHLLVVEVLSEELVLLADLVFVAHTRNGGRRPVAPPEPSAFIIGCNCFRRCATKRWRIA
jgi:hypothetical protein